MKIIHYLHNLDIGGIQGIVLNLARKQISKGHDVFIICSVAGGLMEQSFLNSNISVVVLYPKVSFSIFFSKFDNNIFKHMCNSDVLHIHTFNPYISRLAHKSQTPILFTEHGAFAFGRKKTWRDFVKKYLKIIFLKKYVSHQAFVSEFIREYSIKYLGRIKVPSSIVENGIDVLSDASQETVKSIKNTHDNKFIIGTVGRLVSVKGIDRLIKSVVHLPRDNGWILIIVGDGVERQNLEDLVKFYGINDYVAFIGYSIDVINWYGAFDVCVLPSKDEPFGIVAIESLSQGVETLIFKDAGGLVSVIEGLDNKMIMCDVNALKSRLLTRYKQKNIVSELNKNILKAFRKEYCEFYSSSRMALSYQKIYESIIKY